MTRKDYVAIAGAIRIAGEGLPAREVAVVQRTAYALADTLAADNSRFDRSRFLTACGF